MKLWQISVMVTHLSDRGVALVVSIFRLHSVLRSNGIGNISWKVFRKVAWSISVRASVKEDVLHAVGCGELSCIDSKNKRGSN